MTEKMESRNHSLLIISLSSIALFLFISSSAEATCFARTFNYPIPSASASISSSISSSVSSSSSSPSQSPAPSPPTPKSSPPPPTPSAPTPTPSSSTPSPVQHADSISLFSSTPKLPLIPSFPSIVPGGIDAAVKDICGKTDHVAECLSSVGPLAAAGAHDPVSVFQMQVKALTKMINTAVDTAKTLAHGPSKNTNSCVEDCQELYEDAIDDIKGATDALARKDFSTASIQLSAAMTEFDTCQQGFEDLPGLGSPLTAMNDMLGKLTSNCLAIVDLIKK